MYSAKERPAAKREYNKYFRTGNIKDMNYQARRRYIKSLQNSSQETIQGPGQLLFHRRQNFSEASTTPRLTVDAVPNFDVIERNHVNIDPEGRVVHNKISAADSYKEGSLHLDVQVHQETEKEMVELSHQAKVFYEPYPTMATVIEDLVGFPCREALLARDALYYPKSFNEMINNENFLKTIDISLAASSGEVLLMTLKYALHNMLSASGLISLLHFVNCLFQKPIIFDTKYMLDKIFNPKNNTEFHAVCPTCKMYIGELSNLESFVICKSCQEKIDLSTPSCSNFFVILNPSDAIEDLLNEHVDYYNYVVNERKYQEGLIKDILDGKLYRKFVQELPEAERDSYLTAVFNTDGANKFESSQYSIWPVYLMLNELPPQIRLDNLIVFALYFGKVKPEMTAYLRPCVNALNKYSEKGIACQIKGQLRTFKLYPLLSCVDAVARAPMQGIKQFNGHYGCSWCTHKGVHEGSMRYPLIVPAPTKRTREDTIKLLTEMINNDLDSIDGILYASPLINLRKFNLVDGFCVDPMHCITGVAKQITNELLCPLTEQQMNLINTVLENIKVPVKLGRLTRSLEDMTNWKALEWDNFIAFYSFPLFKLVLNPTKLKYWALFVQSVYILSQEEITFDELSKVRSLLVEFCFKTEEFFSVTAMTYNMHQLLHLVSSVLNWGPLWAHSAYPFESANHDLLQAIHSAKGVNQQIVRYVNLRRYTKILYNAIYKDCSQLVKNFCDDVNNTQLKKCFKLSSITYLGVQTEVPACLLIKLHLNIENTLSYSRIVKENCLYTTNQIENQRSENCHARLENGTFIEIEKFLVDQVSQKELTLYKAIQTTPLDDCPVIHEVVMISKSLRVTETINIKKICVFFTCRNANYIIPVPNNLNY